MHDNDLVELINSYKIIRYFLILFIDYVILTKYGMLRLHPSETAGVQICSAHSGFSTYIFARCANLKLRLKGQIRLLAVSYASPSIVENKGLTSPSL